MMNENLEPGESRDEGPGEASESEGGEAGTAEISPEAARVAELTALLDALRRESSAEFEALRAENERQLEAFCNLARSLPGVVPELVGGATLEAAQSSLEAAREAFNRVAANLAAASPGPAGGVELVAGSGVGGGTRSGWSGGEDGPARLSSERGVNLIYQAIAGGKSGNLAR